MALSADLLIQNATIHTLDPNRPTAHSLAVIGDRVIALDGDADGLRGRATRVVDAGWRTVLPGLHDAHLHFLMHGTSLSRVDLFEVPSLAEAQRRVAERAASLPADGWILGRGWKQDLWATGAFPTAADLDAHCGGRPALLRDNSGHAAWANSRAMELAGIDSGTPDPPGGVIQRDASGRPTGIFFEDACGLVGRWVPAPTDADCDAAILAAQDAALACGLTCVQCFDGRESIRAVQRLAADGRLSIRVVHHFHPDVLEELAAVGLRPRAAGLTRLGCLKLFADGALGPRTALMLQPYEGEPDNLGVGCLTADELEELPRRASAAGFATAVHAIGDRACREVLDAFARLRGWEAQQGIAPETRRHRIEHVQILHPDDLGRLADLGVIGSMQPIHATQDMDMVDRWWGARGRYAYAFATLASRGTRLAFGSDAPVESINPFVGLHAAVTHRRADGSPGPAGWHPEEKLSLQAAVEGFTVGAAAAAGWDDLGRLTPGYLADLIVVDADPWVGDPMDLLARRPVFCVVGGRVVHSTGEVA